jgi:hypothetical protein
MNGMMAWADRLWDSVSQERCLTGARTFRLVAGMSVLLEYLVNYAQRNYLFGPNGVYPYAAFAASTSGFSVYRWSASPAFFEVCFHLGVLVAILWFMGYWTRLLTPLNYFFWFSLHQRNLAVWDGGDNVMQLVFVYAMFANLTGRANAATHGGSTWRAACRVVHNAAILAIGIQISLVYGVAGLCKVQGTSWQNGTALYYALRSSEFRLPGLSERLYSNALFLTFICYSTVAFQTSFPFLLLIGRRTRAVAVAIAMMFHVGIMYAMGLVTFGLFMMACDLAIVGDTEYAQLARGARWLARTAGAPLRGRWWRPWQFEQAERGP